MIKYWKDSKMAFLRQAYGRYYLDMSGEELNALVDVMEELPSMTKVERGIWYQITKHRDFLKQEEKWHRTEEARQEVLAEAKLNP
jgi:hypothetical protein